MNSATLKATVYKEWAGDALTDGLKQDTNGDYTILSTSSCTPLAEPLPTLAVCTPVNAVEGGGGSCDNAEPGESVRNQGVLGDAGASIDVGDVRGGSLPLPPVRKGSTFATRRHEEHFRIMHPAHLHTATGGVSTFADARVGMDIMMLAAAPETLARKISQSAQELLKRDLFLISKASSLKRSSHRDSNPTMRMDKCTVLVFRRVVYNRGCSCCSRVRVLLG
jgi:hypothetical protein